MPWCACLLVSNDASFRALLRSVLADEPLTLVESDGADLAVRLRELQPAVVALDVSVRDQALRWAQVAALPEAQPVVICPSSLWVLDGPGAILARPNVAVWAEPFDPSELIQHVRRAVSATLATNGQLT